MDYCIHIKNIVEDNCDANREFGRAQKSNPPSKRLIDQPFAKRFKFIQHYIQGWKAQILNTKKIAIPRCSICNGTGSNLVNLYICIKCGGCFCYKNGHIQRHYEMNPTHLLALEVSVNEVYCHICDRHVYHQTIHKIALETKIEMIEAKMRIDHVLPGRVKFKLWHPNEEEIDCIKAHGGTSNIPACILGLRGLNNLGNTCFMNVILQTFSHSSMSSYFLADKHNNQSCYLSKMTQFCLCCELDFVIDNMYNSDHSFFSPHNFLYTTWTISDHLAGYVQQDAHDFFITSLNTLHTHFLQSKYLKFLMKFNANGDFQLPNSSNSTDNDVIARSKVKDTSCSINSNSDLGLIKNFNSSQELGVFKKLDATTTTNNNGNNKIREDGLPKNFTLGFEEFSKLKSTWNGRFSSCTCPAHQIFDGTLRSDVRCFTCNFTSSSYESFLDISLELSSNGFTNLQECINNFIKPEFVDHYYCESCCQKVQSIKQLSFHLLPFTFCFHLKRFKQTMNGTIKIDTYVKFPLHLDMTPYLDSSVQKKDFFRNKDNNNNESTDDRNDEADDFAFVFDPSIPFSDLGKKFYSLFSVVNHSGTMDNGHYTCYIKNLDTWFKCDDHVITQVPVSEILLSKAYLLFYTKSTLEYIDPEYIKRGLDSIVKKNHHEKVVS